MTEVCLFQFRLTSRQYHTLHFLPIRHATFPQDVLQYFAMCLMYLGLVPKAPELSTSKTSEMLLFRVHRSVSLPNGGT